MRFLRSLSIPAIAFFAAPTAAHGQDKPGSPSSSVPESPRRVPGFDAAALDPLLNEINFPDW